MRGSPTISPRIRSSSTRPASTPRGSRAASTRRPPAASAAKARWRPSPSRPSASSRELRVARRRALRAARCAARCTGRVRRHRGPARDRTLRPRGNIALCTRGRWPSQRAGQGDRVGSPSRTAAARGLGALRQRKALVRARAEGGRRRLSGARRGRRAVVARRRAGTGSRRHALWLRPQRAAATSTASRGASADGRAAGRRRKHALRLTEGAHRGRRRAARRPRATRARRGVRRGARRRQAWGAAVRRPARRGGRARPDRRRRRGPACGGSTTSPCSCPSTARG